MKIARVSIALLILAVAAGSVLAQEVLIPCNNGCNPASSCPTGTTQQGDCSNSSPVACGTCTGTVKCYNSRGVLKETIHCTGTCTKIHPADELPAIVSGPVCAVDSPETDDLAGAQPSESPENDGAHARCLPGARQSAERARGQRVDA